MILLIRLQQETLSYSLMVLIYLFLVKLKLRLMKMPRLSLVGFMNICSVISCTLTLLNLFTCIFDLTLIKTTDRPVQNVELKNLKLGNFTMKKVKEVKFLGVIIDDELSWGPKINCLTEKLISSIVIIKRIKKYIPVTEYLNSKAL